MVENKPLIDNKLNERYEEFVIKTFDELKTQFLRKNKQYGGFNPLRNFMSGARLRYQNDDLPSCYETCLDYEAKHVAHVFNNTIRGDKVDESLKDIAIYSVIELFLINEFKRDKF